MRIINEIRHITPPYRCVCIEFGNMETVYRLRIGLLITREKSKPFHTYKWLNNRNKGWAVTVKWFSMALLKRIIVNENISA